MVALIIVLGTKLISANFATPNGVSKVLTPSDHRLSIQEPTTLSSVLPVAIAVEVIIDPAVVMFARNAATKIAGQIRYPNKRMAANANPVAGQIGVALGCTDASTRPSLAREIDSPPVRACI
jgi:hypothetical protein